MIEMSKEKVCYRYFVEGRKDEVGEVCYDFTTQKFDLLDAPLTDRFGSYSVHAFSRMRKYIREGHFESEDMVAWY